MAQPVVGGHALVFRIMRLARPSLSPEDPLKFDLGRDLGPHTHPSDPQLGSALPAGYPFAGRVQLADHPGASAALGISGLLALPQAFGLVYLGETFQAYVTVCNYSEQPVSNVAVKVELQTEGGKAVLYDNTPSPVQMLAPGQRHDFLVRHDVKELGAHTLACASLYTAGDGERKYLPQHFRFSTANPLVVRTRHRQVSGQVFLEATLENITKGPIVMEQVAFQPASPFPALRIPASGAAGAPAGGGAGDAAGGGGGAGPLGEYLSEAPIVPEGCSLSYLFQLSKPPHAAQPHAAAAAAAAGDERPAAGGAVALGRLEIRWRGHMGQPARLQTQTITTPAPAPCDLSLALAGMPAQVVAERPFALELSVKNATDRLLGPVKISFAGPAGAGASGGAGSGSEAGGAPLAAGVVMDGPQSLIVDRIPPRQAVPVVLHLIALTPGQHAVQGISLFGERDGTQYDTLERQDLYVLPACA